MKAGKKKNVVLFEKYLIINIDNIQRKYAIRSRYGINKNLTTGPDLQNIIKSDNDKGVTSHTLYSYQYFANKIHRVDHIFLLSYISFLFSFFLIFINFSCKFAIASNLRLAQIAYARYEMEIHKETQREISTAFLFVNFISLYLREKRKKQVAILVVSVFSATRMSLVLHFVILSSCYFITIN